MKYFVVLLLLSFSFTPGLPSKTFLHPTKTSVIITLDDIDSNVISMSGLKKANFIHVKKAMTNGQMFSYYYSLLSCTITILPPGAVVETSPGHKDVKIDPNVHLYNVTWNMIPPDLKKRVKPGYQILIGNLQINRLTDFVIEKGSYWTVVADK